ncbi:MAG TPA: von Willebrand factor type A domain-containing protein, partial [Polyangiales bacterium]|nr:von Willebrand factor type A domain-containing protein [Polyangiales bacterium]
MIRQPTDDYRLTAYALGELDDAEASSLEAQLASDPFARAELVEIRQVCALLQRELSVADELGPAEGSAASASQLKPALPAEPAVRRSIGVERKRLGRMARAGSALSAVVALAWLGLFLYGDHPSSLAETISLGGGYVEFNDDAEPDVAGGVPGVHLPATGEHDHDHDDNPFVPVASDPRSTFSIDVDTASYALVRGYLQQRETLPPKGAVRIEELVNYFSYAYPEPRGEEPFALTADLAAAPWAPEHRLLRLALKARHIPAPNRPASTLVFLID